MAAMWLLSVHASATLLVALLSDAYTMVDDAGGMRKCNSAPVLQPSALSDKAI